MRNLLATTIRSGSFSAFVTAISRARLGHLLSKPGPFTVFVPTNAAFAQATGGGLWSLTDDISILTRVLACHIVPGRWTAAAMVRRRSLRSVRSELVEVELDGGIRVGGAHVLKPDLIAANRVLHITDGVILPPGLPWVGIHTGPVLIARPSNSSGEMMPA
jgi:uncharacterized surface protein with fasciclin (FAS1) repeats